MTGKSGEEFLQHIADMAALHGTDDLDQKRGIDGKGLDVLALPVGTKSLSIDYIRKPEFKNLAGLDKLPLEDLELRRFSGADLSVVPIPPTLKTLYIWQCIKLKSMAGLEVAQQLQDLTWRQNGLLEDATALALLPGLKRLSLEGGFDRMQQLESIDFLEGLQLEELGLGGIKSDQLDLGPIARMASLQKIDLNPINFASEEVAKVAAAHPDFYKDLLELPTFSRLSMGACKKCDGMKVALFLKGKKLMWCPDCERMGLQRHLDNFCEIVEKARSAALNI